MPGQLGSPLPGQLPGQLGAMGPMAGLVPLQDQLEYSLSISNLPFSVRWQDLKDLVKEVVPPNQIARVEVYTLENKRSQGVGTVRVRGRDAAIKCVQFLDGYEWHSRSLSVVLLMHSATPQMGMPQMPYGSQLGGQMASPLVGQYGQYGQYTAQPAGAGLRGQPASPPHLAGQYPPGYVAQTPSGPVQIPVPMHMLSAGVMDMSLGPAAYSAMPALSALANTPGYGGYGKPGRPAPGAQVYPVDRRKIFVGNVPYKTQWRDLKEFIRPAGLINRIEIISNNEGQSKGFAIVIFAAEEDALKAIELYNGAEFEGRVLTVRFDRYPDSGFAAKPHSTPLAAPVPVPALVPAPPSAGEASPAPASPALSGASAASGL
ncbi:uncharacterized protein V1510DRAFT_303230 [Dipodascopsis tothii]|uniref:uncharacterized protein n=1 Tax=Dipodascopsis tothii TaxID=44089 RepID=UPI0034CDA21D